MAQTAQKFQDQRASPRYKLVNKQLPGELYLEDSGRAVFAVAVDASKYGLGVKIAERLDSGTNLILAISGRRLLLRVVWSKKHKTNLYRHGLMVIDKLDKSIDIEDLLFASGCLEFDLDDLP